jgi:hypothetical protein
MNDQCCFGYTLLEGLGRKFLVHQDVSTVSLPRVVFSSRYKTEIAADQTWSKSKYRSVMGASRQGSSAVTDGCTEA